MTRHENRRRTDSRLARRGGLGTRTAAASALAGGCLAVMALWRSAAGNDATAGGGRR